MEDSIDNGYKRSGQLFFEYRLFVLVYWQKSHVNMRIGFIEMDNESDNIFFAPFVTCRSVHILYLTFNIRTSFYAGVGSTLYKIHLLISESYFKHTLTVTAKNEVDNRSILGNLPIFIRGFDATSCQTLKYAYKFNRHQV